MPWDVIKDARKWNLHGHRPHPDDGHRPRRPVRRHLRRGAALGLRRHRAGDLRLLAGRRRHRRVGHARADRPSGSPSASATGDEIKLGAYAVTEAGAGSDVKSLRTTAKLDGDEWVLNGTKVFISNGGIADVNVVVATVDPELGHRGQASFIVPKDTPGLSMGKKEDKIGIRASQTAEVVLEDCRIPVDYLLGGMDKLEQEARARPLGADAAASPTRSRRSRSPARWSAPRRSASRRRPTSGRSSTSRTRSDEDGPLIEQQRVQQVLADVATEIEAARLLVWRAAWMGRNGMPMTGGPGLDVEAQGGRRDDVGHDHADGPRRRLRADHGLPAREVVPRRQDLPDLRGHGPGPAARRLAHAARRVPAERTAAEECSRRLRATRPETTRSAKQNPQPPRFRRPDGALVSACGWIAARHTNGRGFSFDPAVIALLAGADRLYVRAVRVLARRGYDVPFWQQVAWHGGVALIAIGLLGPLDGARRRPAVGPHGASTC